MAGGRRARGSCACLVLAACLGLSPSQAAAADSPIQALLNLPVTRVRFEMEGREVIDPQVADLVETRTGAPLQMAAVRETMTHLFGLGRFQDIRVHADRSGGGVALLYELVPLHSVRAIVFRGATGLSERDLRLAVVDRFGASPPVGRAAEAARTLVSLYHDHGYMSATVTPSTRVEHSPDRTTLLFDVTPGPRTTISTIAVDGNPVLSRAEFLARLKLQPGHPYEQPDVVSRLARYSDELRGRGYYEARLEHTAIFSEDNRTASLTLSVDPGAHFQVVFEGDPLPSQQRRDLVPIERDGSVDEDLLEDSNHRIEAYLQSQGYRDADSENARAGDAREQTIVFRIHRGRQYRMADVEISGNTALPDRELRSLLRIESGDPYVQSTVDAGVGRIAEAYHRRGYASVNVKADATRVSDGSGGLNERVVTIVLHITEGVATMIGSLVFRGNGTIGSDVLGRDLGSQPGKPLYQPQLSTDLDSVVVRYLNRGFQNVTATPNVIYNSDRSRADIEVIVKEGSQIFVDYIMIVGNNRTRADTIERELVVKPGQPLGLNDLVESQRRLSALGLFRRARITELRHAGAETPRDLLVTVEEAPLTTIGYGVGVEGGRFLRRVAGQEGAVEVFEAAPRGFFEVGRRNLWGKNRSVNLFTRVSFRRRNAVDSIDPTLITEGDGYGFNEYRVLFTYREPKVFGSAADALLTAFADQGVRSSFNFNRKGIRGELGRRFPSAISVSARYTFDTTRLFDQRIRPADKPLIDRLFPQVRLSSFAGSLIRDTRDDPLDPGRGQLIGLDGQLAARAIGSEVGFVKTSLQGFLYRRIPGRRRIVVAGGARIGLASGFPREVVQTDENGQPVLGPDGQPITVVVEDIPASERFFAGGDTTVRGFALDRLGTPETFDQDGFPKGGHALVIFNGEVRVPVWRDLGVVGFIDSGNVFEFVNDLDLGRIRGAAGFGIRYKSPIGPLRIDLGFKLDRREFSDGQLERRTALHISLGQAF